MKKTIKIIDVYNLFKKYGDLDLSVKSPYGYKKILACDITAKDSLFVTIKTENDKSLTCAPEHKVKVSNGKFVSANNLKFGKSKILTDSGVSMLKSIEFSKERKDLYDIQVEGVQQYYSNGIVSHNSTILKLICYILYNNTRETEKTMKFGDQRYVNNRNNSDFCEGQLVLLINGEYYGIKRATRIEKTKTGEIKGAPTTLNYYKLKNIDDELSDDNSLENLIGDERDKTQSKLEKAIGTYENFMRVVMTTSDSLNEILSNNKADFIDSILNDSGLDIFDLKLEAFKQYNKELSSVPRVSCNVETSEELIKKLDIDNEEIDKKIKNIETVETPELLDKISKGEEYLETLIKKLNKIDEDIYNLDVDDTNRSIDNINSNIKILEEKQNRLNNAISTLKESYDKERLVELEQKKDEHRNKEHLIKLDIKEKERSIIDIEYKRGVINGDIHRLKEQGKEYKETIFKFKNEKNCPTCGQLLDDKHQVHINDQIKQVEEKMFSVVKSIKEKEKEIPPYDMEIESYKNEIVEMNSTIEKMSLDMENVLNEIGEITNDKNEVDRRNEMLLELENLPIKLENNNLQIMNLQQKINMFNQSQKQIDENQKINVGIDKSRERLNTLKNDKESLKDDLYALNTSRGHNVIKIQETNDLIVKFKTQEKQDNLLATYKKCIHRDGIPTQLLKSYAIPKINNELTSLLSNVDFNVWLDEDDLKLKFAYNSRLDAIIDAISASGKERTFSSVTLKFALNQINMKSKPNLFLLDEVSGKLTDDSVDEFVEVLGLIKNRTGKVLIIEHNHYVNPDYIINVVKNDKDISTLTIE